MSGLIQDKQILNDETDSDYNALLGWMERRCDAARDADCSDAVILSFERLCSKRNKSVVQDAAVRLISQGEGEFVVKTLIHELSLMTDDRIRPYCHETIFETGERLVWHPAFKRLFFRANDKAGWLLGSPLPAASGVNWSEVASARLALGEAMRHASPNKVTNSAKEKVKSFITLIEDAVLGVSITEGNASSQKPSLTMAGILEQTSDDVKTLIAQRLSTGGVRLRLGAFAHDCRGRGGEFLNAALQKTGGLTWRDMPHEIRHGSVQSAMKVAVARSLKGAPSQIAKYFRITAYGIEIKPGVDYRPE